MKACIKRKITFYLFCVLLAFSQSFQMAYSSDYSDYENCILMKISESTSDTNISDVTNSCDQFKIKIEESLLNKDSSLYNSSKSEQRNMFKPFSLLAYKPNYILPVAYNRSGYDASLYRQQFSGQDIYFDDSEAQFQISFKVPLSTHFIHNDYSLFVAYTNKSFWQVYNSELSSPFRETNHEPEIWLQMKSDFELFGFKNISNMFGFSHQSNGRGGVLSRSWNRAYVRSIFEKGKLALSLKLWSRFKEGPDKDDNPDITEYLGHSELRFTIKNKDNHTFSLMLRNNLESSFERGAFELSWSFPLGNTSDFKGYLQLFSGYGESLIDYNHQVNRLGLGISLSDWL